MYARKEDQATASRCHYEKNVVAIKARSAVAKKAQRLKLAAVVRDAKKCPCADCGGRWPGFVMDFDHGDGKLMNVADMVTSGCSVERLKAEISEMRCGVRQLPPPSYLQGDVDAITSLGSTGSHGQHAVACP